jgi:hypothetical protein
MSQQPDEPLEVLRGIWSAQGQTAADLDDVDGTGRSCQRMQHIGFDELAGADGDLRAAWRSTLRRAGKLNPEAGSVADLILLADRPADQRHPEQAR